ncbi:MAG: tyrosine-type recombinase/integrase, partial [Rhodobacteraceae bacterium]|nr:tyrosine-type recombinase/integrase [Paracoccaceae bacterium]
MTHTNWITAFLEAQAAERGAATNTQLAYARDLQNFVDWLAAQGSDLSQARRTEIESYLVFCNTQGLSRATRARRLSAIKQLYRFTFEENLRQDNPAIKIIGPGREKRLPTILSMDEVDRLLQAAEAFGRTVSDRQRDTCLMHLLYATGMRVSELMSLPLAAARGNPRMLLIRGKGDKERLVPLSRSARDALAVWLDTCDAQAESDRANGKPGSPYLFKSFGRNGHLTRHWFYRRIKDFAQAAGVDPDKVTPHTLRHAFATHLL